MHKFSGSTWTTWTSFKTQTRTPVCSPGGVVFGFPMSADLVLVASADSVVFVVEDLLVSSYAFVVRLGPVLVVFTSGPGFTSSAFWMADSLGKGLLPNEQLPLTSSMSRLKAAAHRVLTLPDR